MFKYLISILFLTATSAPTIARDALPVPTGAPIVAPAGSTIYVNPNTYDNPGLHATGYSAGVYKVEMPASTPPAINTNFQNSFNAFQQPNMNPILTPYAGLAGLMGLKSFYGLGSSKSTKSKSKSDSDFKFVTKKPMEFYKSHPNANHSLEDCDDKDNHQFHGISEIQNKLNEDRYGWRPPELTDAIASALIDRIKNDGRLSQQEKNSLMTALENSKNKVANYPDLRALEKTINSFLDNLGRVKNRNVLTLIDFNKGCDVDRSFTISLKNGQVLMAARVAHGGGKTGENTCVADRNRTSNYQNPPPKFFSNKPNTHLSSFGPMLFTQASNNTQWKNRLGKPYSVLMQGLDGTNNNVNSRAIKSHCHPEMFDSAPRNSWGCPMYSCQDFKELSQYISGSSFVYTNPSDNYVLVN